MAKRLASGEMRHTVIVMQHKIEAGTTAYDSYGQVSISTTAWDHGKRMRAKIEQLSGAELEVARQTYARASYRLTVDYNSTLASTGGGRRLVKFGTRQMFVGGVLNEDLENRQLQLLCGEER
jgi:head-tail adaptor